MIRRFGSKRTLGVALSALSLAAPSLAFAQQGPAPHRYADGTGNNMIEQLNSSQLNNNYKGPYYNRGEAPPPFRPVQVQAPPPPPPLYARTGIIIAHTQYLPDPCNLFPLAVHAEQALPVTPAVILAGGQGSRLGYRNKALIPAGKGALLDQLLDRLRPQIGPVALSIRRDCETAYGRDLTQLQDRHTGAGPLSGVLAALEWAQDLGETAVLTVPVDTAFVPNDLVRRLKAPPSCAMSRGRLHPLVALWPVSSLPLLDEYLSAGVASGDHRQLAVWSFARRIDMTPIAFDDEGPDPFFNVNTPDDLLALTTLIEA